MVKKDEDTGPSEIEWFDPQDKRIDETQCKAESTPARLMKCLLEVDALTNGSLGNYTCKASNSHHYCSTKRFQVHRQQGKSKHRNIKLPARRVENAWHTGRVWHGGRVLFWLAGRRIVELC